MSDYVVATVWWPDGWEPQTPLDVPKCVGLTGEQVSGDFLTYQQAVATVRGLNQQNIDHPGATWYVVAAVKGDSPSATVCRCCEGTSATIEAGRLEVVESHSGGGRGDCSHCPASQFPCAAGS